jgi:hypothetical protein
VGKLIGGLFTVALVLGLAALFLGSATVRFDLITIKPAFWCFLFGIIFALGGGWLVAAEVPVGGLFATLGTILLLLGGYKSIWPNTAKATAHAQEITDSRVALTLDNVVSPKPVRCDRDSKTVYWNQVSGEPIIFFTTDDATGRIECADRKGFHPTTRREYEPVTPGIVKLIQLQAPPDAPKTAPSPAAAQATQPKLVQLGEGPISGLPELGEGPIPSQSQK